MLLPVTDRLNPSQWLVIAGVFVVLVLAIFGWNDVIELRAEEPRRAVVAQEMLHSGNFVVSTINETPYYNKPPFYGWVLSGFIAIAGSSSEAVIRLPGVLSFLFTGFLIFFFGRFYIGEKKAVLAAFCYYTCLHLLLYSSVNAGEIDLFYGCIVALQALLIFWFFERKKWLLLFVCSYALTGIGVLTKGVPSLLFQGVTLCAWFLANQRFRKLFSLEHVAGMVVFSGIAGGYFYLYGLEADVAGYLTNLVDQSSQKSLNESNVPDMLRSLVTFPLKMLEHLLPWGVCLLLFFRKRFRESVRSDRLLRFSAFFIMVNVVFYWLSPDFKARYLSMFLPFFFLLAVSPLSQLLKSLLFRKIVFVVFGGIALLTSLCHFVLPFIPFRDWHFATGAVVFMGMVFLVLAYFLIRKRTSYSTIWFVVAVFICVRLSLNLVVFPQVQAGQYKKRPYRDLMKQVVHIAGEERIYLFSAPQRVYPAIRFAGHVFYQDTVIMATEIAFQLPYYYYEYTGHTLVYEPQPQPGKLYLAYSNHLKKYPHRETLFRFKVALPNSNMELMRLPADRNLTAVSDGTETACGLPH